MAIDREMYDQERIVFDALIQRGYPKNSIVIEGKLDSRRYADFVINDIATGLPMMMIEVKSGGERTLEAVKKLSFESLKRSYAGYDLPIKAVAAILNRVEQRLEFIDFTEAIKENDFERLVDNYILPEYEILIIGAKQKAVQKQENKNKKSIQTLRWLCWLVWPIIGLALILLDAFGVYSFSTLRLIVIGAVVVITLVPCFKEITVGEVSLKNAIEQQKEE